MLFHALGVQQRIDKQRRPLPEVIEELNEKVVDAAKQLQQQLSHSAEQPVASMIEQSVFMDTSADVDLDQNPLLAEFRTRRRKRTASSSSGSAAQPAEQPVRQTLFFDYFYQNFIKKSHFDQNSVTKSRRRQCPQDVPVGGYRPTRPIPDLGLYLPGPGLYLPGPGTSMYQ